MFKRGLPALSLSVLLGSSLLSGCGTPNATVPAPNEDTYFAQAKMAMTSYQETDSSFNDSQALASGNFSTKFLLDGESSTTSSGTASSSGSGTVTATTSTTSANTSASGSTNTTTSLGTVINGGLGGSVDGNTQATAQLANALQVNLSSLKTYDASLGVYQQAASSFQAQLDKSQGIELDSKGQLLISSNLLKMDIQSQLQADADLSNTSMTLDGQLKAGSQNNLSLNKMQALGFSASSSNRLNIGNSSGSSAEAMLFSYSKADAGINTQVRVISKQNTQQNNELNLRLESQAKAYNRTALRKVSRDNEGHVRINSDLSMTLKDGSRFEISELRYINAQGAGAGVGSFTISKNGQSWSGAVRTMTSADGRLMMMMEPQNSAQGRLILQEGSQARAQLARYNSQGQLTASSEIDLKSEVAANAKS